MSGIEMPIGDRALERMPRQVRLAQDQVAGLEQLRQRRTSSHAALIREAVDLLLIAEGVMPRREATADDEGSE